jgi:GT2 family glycosyltransferase
MKVGLCIVFYDDLQHLGRLADALHALEYAELSVFYLDNDPQQKHAVQFETLYQKAIHVKHVGNIGFAAGNNLLAETAIRQGFEAIWILNPDMAPANNSLSELVKLLKNQDDAAAVGPLVFLGDSASNPIIQLAGVRVNFSTQHKQNLYSGVALSAFKPAKPFKVDSLNGGSLLIRSEWFKDVPIFEELYFMYNDEIDLMRRIRDMKKTVWVCPSAWVFHHHNWLRSNALGHYRMYFYMMRNKYLYWKKFGNYVHLCLGLLKDLVLFPIIARFCIKTAGFKLILFYYWGVIHGLIGKSGKTNIAFERSA